MFDLRREGGWGLTQMIGDGEYSGDDRRSIPEEVEVNTVSDDGEIEATREKLMFDFQTEVCFDFDGWSLI
ncbi:hypothetical protein Hanom_Chr09g00855241 [Helianthus anomalus]